MGNRKVGEGRMLAEQRRNKILETMRQERYTQLFHLARLLEVSESTVRRDVEFLVERGLLRRTYGGVAYTDSGDAEGLDRDNLRDGVWGQAFHLPGTPPQGEKTDAQTLEAIHWQEKLAIAKYTARMIPEGDTVLLDGGSTAYAVALELVSRPLTLVTNSLPVANLFASDPANELILVGGSVCPRTGVVRGSYANLMLQQIRVRRAVISAAGIGADGFYNNNVLLVETERTIHKIANELIVVADSSKFGQKSLSHICALDEVDHIVTDDRISREWIDRIRQANVELHIVPVDSAEG
ncbi:MAG: DeoR/GlpR family DNA-binding transcription regulator [Planctomycetia bacterium]|nr:DeoR/GlpR family DNA-binding transcription regulator [Planctomycetia bacterium]